MRGGGRWRGNCAGNAMLESVLTRRSLRHFIKSGHGAVQFSTHFLCTASRATSFPSFPYPLHFCSLSYASSHFLRCPSQLSCSCRNAIHSWPKSFHLALTTFGILELTSRLVGEWKGGEERSPFPRWPLSAATAACRNFQHQLSATATICPTADRHSTQQVSGESWDWFVFKARILNMSIVGWSSSNLVDKMGLLLFLFHSSYL